MNNSPELISKYNLKNAPQNTIFALNRYIDAISQAIKSRLNEGLDTVFMTGKLISGINDYLIKNSQIFKKEYTNLEKIIQERVSNPIKIHIIDGIKDNCDGAMFLENKITKTKISQERGLPVMSLLVKN